MNPLTIEIHGTGTHNRGAELMAIAIAERMRATFPGVRVVVPPNFGLYEARARHGFLTTWEFPGRFRTRTMVRLMPKVVHRAVGIISPAEVDVVLDASGFAYSDQWGPGQARNMLKKMRHPLRHKQSLILLPQALGPFKNPEVAQLSRQLVNRADLVCARDERSLEELRALNSTPNIRKFPDFTVGVSPLPVPTVNLPAQFVAIVPNKRMLDKGDSAQVYLRFLQAAINSLRNRQLNSVFVLHDADEDREVIAQLERNGLTLPMFEHADPRVLKWILGKATLVVGSRFHALVSSLSQGIPCIGAGWSHKYPELFSDFDCVDFLIKDMTRPEVLESILDRLEVPGERQAQSARIVAAARRIKQQNETMWHEVEALIEHSHSAAKF